MYEYYISTYRHFRSQHLIEGEISFLSFLFFFFEGGDHTFFFVIIFSYKLNSLLLHNIEIMKKISENKKLHFY